MTLSRELAMQLKAAGWDQTKYDGGTWFYLYEPGREIWTLHKEPPLHVLPHDVVVPSLEQLLEDFRERGYGYSLTGYEWEGQSKYNFATWHTTLDIYDAEDSGTNPTALVAEAWLRAFGKKAETTVTDPVRPAGDERRAMGVRDDT